MENSMKAIMKMIKSKEREYSNGKMAENTSEIGQTGNKMELEFITWIVLIKKLVYGEMETGRNGTIKKK